MFACRGGCCIGVRVWCLLLGVGYLCWWLGFRLLAWACDFRVDYLVV